MNTIRFGSSTLCPETVQLPAFTRFRISHICTEFNQSADSKKDLRVALFLPVANPLAKLSDEPYLVFE